MTSVAQNFFPPVAFNKGKKYIWNPIHKKRLKDRPEERVRQRIIDFLLTTESWSAHRLGLEVPLNTPDSQNPKRADLICYGDDFAPRILVECKSEDVGLDEKAARQITKYNQELNVPYLLLSNGMQDLWFDLANNTPRLLNTVELPLPATQLPQVSDRGFRYWNARGFLGKNAVPEIRRWCLQALRELDIAQLGNVGSGSVRYITINQKMDELSPSHYYRVVPISRQESPPTYLAMTIASTPYGGTRLMAIYINGNNAEQFMAVNLDLMASGIPINATIYSPGQTTNFNAAEHIPLDLQQPDAIQFETLKNSILQSFDNVLAKS